MGRVVLLGHGVGFGDGHSQGIGHCSSSSDSISSCCICRGHDQCIVDAWLVGHVHVLVDQKVGLLAWETGAQEVRLFASADCDEVRDAFCVEQLSLCFRVRGVRERAMTVSG